MNTSKKLNPTSSEIKKARLRFDLTQKDAAELIGYSRRSWQSWELGDRKMRQATFEYFLSRVNRA